MLLEVIPDHDARSASYKYSCRMTHREELLLKP